MKRIRLIICLLLVGVSLTVVNYSALTKDSPPATERQTLVAATGIDGQAAQTSQTEGCITCHGQIEPMHKYGPTEVYETLKDGKDAVGLSCTRDRKSTRLNSSHGYISYAVFCLKKKKKI